MEITKKQLAQLTKEWSCWAGEPVMIEASTSDEPIYALGSELAMLRLKNKLNCGQVYYSQNMKSWFYSSK